MKVQAKILIVALLLLFAGCAQIPKETPTLLRDSSTIVETRIEALATALNTSSRSAKKSLESIEVIRAELEEDTINKTTIKAQLKIIEQTLEGVSRQGEQVSIAREDAAFVVSNLEIVAGILGEHIELSDLAAETRERVSKIRGKD